MSAQNILTATAVIAAAALVLMATNAVAGKLVLTAVAEAKPVVNMTLIVYPVINVLAVPVLEQALSNVTLPKAV